MRPIDSEITTPNWPETYQGAFRLLEQSIGPHQLKAWIQPLEIAKTELQQNGSHRIEFLAKNDFSAFWVRDHFKHSVDAAFSQILGTPVETFYAAQPSGESSGATPALALLSDSLDQPSLIPYENYVLPDQKRAADGAKREVSSSRSDVPSHMENDLGMGTEALETRPNLPGEKVIPTVHAPERASQKTLVRLNPIYTFDSFVVGNSNQFAHASAVAVAEHPAAQFNPLFLYSRPGLGKTHLLHAIGNRILEKNPMSKVAYLSAESFVIEMIDSLQHKKMAQFRAKYRDSYDVLMIDDIQFIAGKTAIEEEFFHTFNALHTTKRQIVITSDRPPQEIEKLEERMRTRFEWGMVVDMQPPDIETRIAILKSKAERDDIYLPDEVATYLATHVKNNIRVLEGHLVRLQMHASMSGSEISLDMARQQLKAVVPEESPKYTVESIQSAVAKHFEIKNQDFKTATRAQRVALPRQIAMYLVRRYTGLGFAEIGTYFGDRDRTTVMHACEKIEGAIESTPDIKQAVESIQNSL